jgi:hypothetical protein
MASRAPQVQVDARRGGSSAGVVGLLAVAAIGGGLYLASQRPETPPPAKDDAVARVAALARAEKDAEWLRRAIRERQAILGMTFREVETAKGTPQVKERGDTIAEALRSKGGVEIWVYASDTGKPSKVLFDANGRVILSSDVGDTPELHQVIRR